MTELMSIIALFVLVFVGGLAKYYAEKYNLRVWIETAVTEMEEKYEGLEKKGEIKKKEAIDYVYQYVPSFLTPFLTRELIGHMVDACVAEMNAFAKVNIDKAIDNVKMGYTE